MFVSDAPDSSRVVFTVELERHGGPLGLTISGTEEAFDPIFISGLSDGASVQPTHACSHAALLVRGEKSGLGQALFG